LSILWDSSLWNNRKGRKIRSGDLDKYDRYLQVLKTKKAQAHINGKGICTVDGQDVKLYVHTNPNTQFQNVRMLASIFVKGVVGELSLCARSNHQDRPNGFGGYYLCVDYPSQTMYFRKEATHIKGYSNCLAATSVVFLPKVWNTVQFDVVNNEADSGTPMLHGVLNNTYEIEYEDKGTIKCGFDENTPPFVKKGKWCFLKSLNADDLQYKDVSIEDLDRRDVAGVAT
jgi:hypothetical protein